jgi:TonB family protein
MIWIFYRLKIPGLVIFIITFGFLIFQELPVQAQIPKAEKVYEVVQKPARPIGGQENYDKFISYNLIYPVSIIRSGVDGTVEVSFIVEKDGSISDIRVEKEFAEKEFTKACETEALKVIRKAPKWAPARHKGRNVRQRRFYPVKFETTSIEEPPLPMPRTSGN